MQKYQIGLFVILAVYASSCTMVSSLYPLSEHEADFIFKKELVGTWTVAKDSSGACVIDTSSGSNGKLYLIQLISFNKENEVSDTTRLKAHLVILGGTYYFDSWGDPVFRAASDYETYDGLLIPRHFVTKVTFISTNKIEISNMDPDELMKLIRQKKINLAYTTLRKNDYVVLDKPQQLRKAVIQTAGFKSLYKEIVVLEKQ